MSEYLLNLGCGHTKIDGFINIDNRLEVNPDMCLDVTEGLPFKNNSVSYVRAFDFFEHIPIGKVVPFIEELYRVMMPDAMLEHFTPSTDGRGAFQDPTHVSFWNINSWLYYVDAGYRRLYGVKAKFKVIEMYNTTTDKLRNVVHVYGKLITIKP